MRRSMGSSSMRRKLWWTDIFILETFGRMLPGGKVAEVVYECFDNTTAESLMRKGSVRSSRNKADAISIRRNTLLQELGLSTRQLRVPTKSNWFADTLSRDGEEEFLRGAALLGFAPVLVKLSHQARDLSWLLSA